MNPREVYERNPHFTGREEQFKLRPHEWEVYVRLDGRRSLQEVGEARRLDLTWIVSAVTRLEQLELIRVVEVGLEEFHQRFVNGAAPALIVAPATTPESGPAPAAAADGKRLSFSIRRGESLANRASAPVEPSAAAASVKDVPVPALAPIAEDFHLKPLLDFIIGHSGGGTVGQLAVYRVFLKVPNELLRQAGIRSLNLVGADFTINDPMLKRSLLAAVEEVLGRPYTPPAPVHAAAAASPEMLTS